ncbi:MAG: hypothetical protein OEU40_16550 [Gammaproteobacteria bacterium]|nr:hypothetical protein [Gammaproteobacteria bacterium]
MRHHQAVVYLQAVNLFINSPILVFQRASPFNNIVDPFLGLLSQVQPTIFGLQDLVDRLGEYAAGCRNYCRCKECNAYAPTAAYAPFHERSLIKGRLLLIIFTERDATYPLNTCTTATQNTQIVNLHAHAALSTFAAAMNFSWTFLYLFYLWLPAAVEPRFPAIYCSDIHQVPKYPWPRITYAC